jgi:hypothetical protein
LTAVYALTRIIFECPQALRQPPGGAPPQRRGSRDADCKNPGLRPRLWGGGFRRCKWMGIIVRVAWRWPEAWRDNAAFRHLPLACSDLTFGSQLSALVIAAVAIPHYAYL